ncbi:MAG: glutamine amidotransferase-related protein, partial [Methanobacteriota archaeon]
ITSQNHGFAVDPESAKAAGLRVTQLNANDQTVEAMRHERDTAFSVQYHPEAHPGPRDTTYLFDTFVSMFRGGPS